MDTTDLIQTVATETIVLPDGGVATTKPGS